MSTINPHYTLEYSQPPEYHFSHDSIFLARQVFELLATEDLTQFDILDLCAGCGVIGFDFLFHCHKTQQALPQSMTFLEVQETYRPHFEKNKNHFLNFSTRLEYKNINYKALLTNEYKDHYDLILCNPPYFQVSQGKLSPSEFKNRCRFFIDSDFEHLIRGIENSLKRGSRAFILFRDLRDHGLNYIDEAKKILTSSVILKKIGTIRGTDLICLSK